MTSLQYWVAPIVMSGMLWWYTTNPVSTLQALAAMLLLIIPCVAYGAWKRRPAARIPLFAILGAAYWVAFAMPLFLSSPPVDPRTLRRFTEGDVFQALAMAVVGVLAMGAGMRVPLRPFNPAWLPDVVDTPGAWRYLYCAMAVGTFLSFRLDSLGVSAGIAQIINALANIVPITICCMLLVLKMQGTATPSQRLALHIFLVARVLGGIAAGVLGQVAFLGVILALVYLSERRRLPLAAIAVLVPVVLFLQAGKGDFRTVYWAEGHSAGVIEKAGFWLNASWRQWASVFDSRGHGRVRNPAGESVQRMELLNQAVNVIVKTPHVVPYQQGKTYSYLAATLIPRMVWPDKPSMSEANRFYQVAYGLTTKENLANVSISVGCLAESFINFGWWGVVPVMFAIGIILGMFQHTLLNFHSGLLFCGVGLALMNIVISVESQAAQYFSGMIQQITVVFFVALPVIRRRRGQHGFAEAA